MRVVSTELERNARRSASEEERGVMKYVLFSEVAGGWLGGNTRWRETRKPTTTVKKKQRGN